MLTTIVYSFFFKDLMFFNNWLKTNLERFPVKKHKKFLFYLKIILKLLFNNFKMIFKIKGFFLDIRGKVAVIGNAKKRHYSILLGNYSNSTKFLKIDVKKNIIRTSTGVLGLTLALTY